MEEIWTIKTNSPNNEYFEPKEIPKWSERIFVQSKDTFENDWFRFNNSIQDDYEELKALAEGIGDSFNIKKEDLPIDHKYFDSQIGINRFETLKTLFFNWFNENDYWDDSDPEEINNDRVAHENFIADIDNCIHFLQTLQKNNYQWRLQIDVF